MTYRNLIFLFLLCLFPISLALAGDELTKVSGLGETSVSSEEPPQNEAYHTPIEIMNEKINLEINASEQQAAQVKQVTGQLEQIKAEHKALSEKVINVSSNAAASHSEMLLKAKLVNADLKKAFLEKRVNYLKERTDFRKLLHRKLNDYLKTVFSDSASFFVINNEIKELRQNRVDRKLQQIHLVREIAPISNRIEIEMKYLSAKDALLAVDSDAEKSYTKETIALAEERLQILKDTKALVDEELEFVKARISGNAEFENLVRLRRGEVFAREFYSKYPYPFRTIEIACVFLTAFFLAGIFLIRKKIFPIISGYQLFSCKGLFLPVVKIILFLGGIALVGYGVLNLFGFRFAAQILGLMYLNIVGGAIFFFISSGVVEKISVWVIQMISKTSQGEVRNSSAVYSLLNAGFQVFAFIAISSEILFFWAFRQEVTQSLLSILNHPFFKAEKIELSLWILARSVLVFWGFHWFSRFTNSVLKTHVYPKTSLDRNSQYAIKAVVQFVLITVGAVLAIQLLGIDLSALAVFSGTLGLGIGLGLQDIIKNIVSGFVIYFERPIRIGDVVEVGTTPGQVKSIRTRSTIINTFDNISLVVPNSEFLSQRVVNWSLSDRIVRMEARVGVAYGSDVEVVRQTLLEITKANENIMQHPAPMVVFEDFADSALLFRVLFWVDVEDRMEVKSQINFSIYSQFKEKGIVIPFPQRDVHIKSSDIEFQKKT